ncbi:cysteine desulfurase [Candidatus Saccharibacteria bacterium]|nr:cysteine desulfurase [Candidatus Saccharibacteria bacterium]
MNSSVYLDYAAATPVDARVIAAMQPYFSDAFYNPSASYKAARAVRADVEQARGMLADWLGAKAREVIVTAGATESANLALHGVMRAHPGASVAVGAIEHDAVLETARQYPHEIIPVDDSGAVGEQALRAAIRDDTVLVSIGYASGMLGTLQPIKRLGQLIAAVRTERREAGNTLPLYFYTDASQAAAYADMHVSRLGVDLMTVGAQKLYGPKQVGLLYVRTGTQLSVVMQGGGQESGLRSGTENVPGIIGFAEAVRLVRAERDERACHVGQLRALFEKRLQEALGDSCVFTTARQRIPHISHFVMPGIDAETLLFMLDERDIMVATGAACAANKQTASTVLLAIGLDEAHRQGSLRCSFSHLLTLEDVERAVKEIIGCVRIMKDTA